MKHLMNDTSVDLLALIEEEIQKFITEDEEEVIFPSTDNIKDRAKRLIINAFNRGEKYGRFYTLMELKDALKERKEDVEGEVS